MKVVGVISSPAGRGAVVAPPGDIGGTNPGIITTTLLTRENLQHQHRSISGNISGVVNIFSREIFLVNPNIICREISLPATLCPARNIINQGGQGP